MANLGVIFYFATFHERFKFILLEELLKGGKIFILIFILRSLIFLVSFCKRYLEPLKKVYSSIERDFAVILVRLSPFSKTFTRNSKLTRPADGNCRDAG